VICDRMPSFLALHLNNVDAAHHRYGPKSGPGYTAAALNDANVGRVLRALDQAGVRDQTTVFVVSDHGFIAVPRSLRPNALLRRDGLLEVKDGKIASGRVLAFPSGGCSIVFLTDPGTAAQDRETVRRLFSQAEGIAGILEPGDYPRFHLPSPEVNRSMGDLVLVAKEGFSFDLEATGDAFVVPNPNPTAGTHGFLSTEPKMNAIFVASGAGIKVGQQIKAVANVDVAPTVAQILGVSLKDATGRVLNECLDRRNGAGTK
jgi:predicted AlkP superfamily pyrophosphatase or phosphodiesterase